MNTIHETSYDFANILFSGKCNAKCPYCIGQKLDITYPSNLDTYPLKNIDSFINLVKQFDIPEVIFTGTTTDPQLYRHESKLLDFISSELPAQRRALHTNGFLILRKIESFNSYTKCTLSLPSFRQEIFEIMMGTKQNIPDIKRIDESSDIPIKASRIVSNTNNFLEETRHYIETLLSTNIKRVAFRKLAGDMSNWDDTIDQIISIGGIKTGEYKKNDIYSVGDLEITLWSFDTTGSQSINLFSNGHISQQYLLSDSKK